MDQDQPQHLLESGKQTASLEVGKMISTQEEQLPGRIWPEWAAAFPQIEAEILMSLWPFRAF